MGRNMTQIVGLTEREPERVFKIFCPYRSPETAFEVEHYTIKTSINVFKHANLESLNERN